MASNVAQAPVLPDNWNYCDLCSVTKNINWKCINCEDILCESCKNKHERGRTTHSHAIINKTDRDREEKLKSSIRCDIHAHQDVIMYCMTCKSLVCAMCMVSSNKTHTGHCFEDIDKIADIITHKMKEKIKIAKQNCSQSIKKYDQTIESRKSKFSETVEQKYKSLNAELDKEMQFIKNENDMKFVKSSQQFHRDITEKKHWLNFLSSSIGKKLKTEIIRNEQSLLSAIDENSTIELPELPDGRLDCDENSISFRFAKLLNCEKLPQSESKLKRDLRDAEERVKHLEKEREELLKEKKNNIEEIDNLKNRLSQLAGAKLIDSNPAIADLSDFNQPLNLEEKYSELYDNQWTDALEEVENVFKNEEKAITFLLETVMNAYKFCLKKADDYLNSLKGGACKVTGKRDPTSQELKLMKDHRKAMAVHLSLGLQEEFCKMNEVKHKQKENTVAYQKKCVLVCWFMTVQDPAVYIDSKENVKGKPFDIDKYKYYTKTGKVADYLVWPVLYLHKDGPMLGKGVAQGQK